MSIELAAYRERDSVDPHTGVSGIFRKEWRVRLLGDRTHGEQSVEYDDVRFSCNGRVGEWVMEERCIVRGIDRGWTIFDTSDSLDDLLATVEDGAVALHPRLLELRGEWAAAEQRRKEQAAKEAEEEAERQAHYAAKRKHQEAWNRLRENPRHKELFTRWCAHVAHVKEAPVLQENLIEDPKFYASGQAVYDGQTVPQIVKAMKNHLELWGDKPNLPA